MLEAQCGNWGGVTSVAMYWPLLFVQGNVTNAAELVEAKAAIQAFHDRMEVEGAHQESRSSGS